MIRSQRREFGAHRTRSGHVLLALVSDDTFLRQAREASREFEKIPPPTLRAELVKITSESVEAGKDTAPVGAPGAPTAAGATTGGAVSGSALDQFTIDLTARAAAGEACSMRRDDHEGLARPCGGEVVARRLRRPLNPASPAPTARS